jgi:hypothetical protein
MSRKSQTDQAAKRPRRKSTRPLSTEEFCRRHGISPETLERVADLAMSPDTPWSEDKAIALLNTISCLREREDDVYLALFDHDVSAAVASQDLARLARCVLFMLNHYACVDFSKKLAAYADREQRQRESTATLPFDRLCLRWWEIDGTKVEKARHVVATEGGNIHQHLNRVDRNWPAVLDRKPRD